MAAHADMNLDAGERVESMVIVSYGAHSHPVNGFKIAKKQAPTGSGQFSSTDVELEQEKKEIALINSMLNQVDKGMTCHCQDPSLPYMAQTWSYYLPKIKDLFKTTTVDHAVLFYTGNSELGSGNWCFEDGVISFKDIYDLYIEYYRGKRLTIISDCSYSGSWVEDCANIYDDQGIPSCGHHSRNKGLLIRVATSCQSYQQATIMTYVRSVDQHKANLLEYVCTENELLLGQTTASGDFCIETHCKMPAEQDCERQAGDTWKNELLGGIKINCIGKNWYVFRGVSKNMKPYWKCVKADREGKVKIEELQPLNLRCDKTELTVDDYGHIKYQGDGDDEIKKIKKIIKENLKKYDFDTPQ